MAGRDPGDLEQVAERGRVRVQQVVVREIGRLAEHEQRRDPHLLERRRLARHLAVGGDDGALAVAVAEAPVVVLEQVHAQLLLDELARGRREDALLVAAVDPLGERDVRAVAPRVLRRREADVRREPDRGIEQDEPLDPLRRGGRDLVGDAAAERVPEPGAAAVGRRLEHVRDVLLEVPRRLPRRGAVPAQVERDDVEAVGQPLGELREVAAVARDAVQADERRRGLVAPLVAGEAHAEAESGPLTSSSRRVSVLVDEAPDDDARPCRSGRCRAPARRGPRRRRRRPSRRRRAARSPRRACRSSAELLASTPAAPGAASHETRITSVSALSNDGRFACRSSASSSQTGVHANGWKTSRTFRLPRKSASRTRVRPVDLEVEVRRLTPRLDHPSLLLAVARGR